MEGFPGPGNQHQENRPTRQCQAGQRNNAEKNIESKVLGNVLIGPFDVGTGLPL